MPCFISESDGSMRATRSVHLSDEIMAAVTAERDLALQASVSSRLKEQGLVFAKLSVPETEDLAMPGANAPDLVENQAKLEELERMAVSKEAALVSRAAILDNREAREKERASENGVSRLSLSRQQEELTGLASKLEQGRLQLKNENADLSAREAHLEKDAASLKRRESQLRDTEEDLRQKATRSSDRELDLGKSESSLAQDRAGLDDRARALDNKAAQISEKDRRLQERESRREAAKLLERRRTETKIAALEAGFAAAHGPEMALWQEEAFQQARETIPKARSLLSTGDLSKADLTVERANAELTAIEKQAFDDQRQDEVRKRTTGILVSSLHQLGYQRIGAKIRDKDAPESDVDVAGMLPSGKSVVFSLAHDGTVVIRQRGVSGHQECHTVEDAIATVAKDMGLTLVGGQHARIPSDPTGPAHKVAGKAGVDPLSGIRHGSQ